MDLTLLRNEANAALVAARAIADDPEGTDDAYDAAMADYQAKLKAYDRAAELIQAAADLNNRAIPGQDASFRDITPSPTNVSPVTLEVANADPTKFKMIASGTIVPYASKLTEGYVRAFPAAVQKPEIMARYGPELALEAEAQRDAWRAMMRMGETRFRTLRPEQVKFLDALQEGTDSEGGFLVPSDQRTEMIHDPGVLAGTFRRLSRVLQTSRDAGTFPSGTTVTWGAIAEEADPGASDPVFAQVPFTIRKSGVNFRLSEELLTDEATGLEAFLNQIVLESSGRYEDQQGIEGDGTTEPLGLRTAASHGTITDHTPLLPTTGPTIAITVEMYFGVPAQYRPGNLAWHMTSALFTDFAALAPSGGQLWTLPQGTERPVPRLLGAPVEMFDGTGWDDAGTLGVNEEVGAIGNFDNYVFMDRIGTTMRRDDSVYSASDQILIRARKRYDSFFTVANAFRIIKVAAS